MFKLLILPQKGDSIHLTQVHISAGATGSPFLVEYRGDDGQSYMGYSIVTENITQQIVYLLLSSDRVPAQIPVTTWDDSDQALTHLYDLNELKVLNS